MTAPFRLLHESTAASTPVVGIPADAAITALHIPGNVYVVRPETGQREMVITEYDLSMARTLGNPVSPAWSDPGLVIETYKLGPLLEACERIVREVFGAGASVSAGVERDPDSFAPQLIFCLTVPRNKRHLRSGFFGRYAQEIVIPPGAPVPVLLWEYYDGIPA